MGTTMADLRVTICAMCRRVFPGADAPLPTVDLTAGGRDFRIRAVHHDDRGVRAQLGVRFLVEAATDQECACDFDAAKEELLATTFPSDAEQAESLARAVARARKLHGYVATAMRAGAIGVFAYWWDEVQVPPRGSRDVDVGWFLHPDLEHADRSILRVRP